MKTFKFIAIMLVLAGSMASCKDKAEKEEIGENVPYKPCPCGETHSSDQLQFQKGEAYFFRDSIPEQMSNQINKEIYSTPFPIVCWIVYYSKTDTGNIYFRNSSGGMTCVGTICNFPDFAKKWDLPENGCKVYFKGRAYEPCDASGIANVVYIDYILTRLTSK